MPLRDVKSAHQVATPARHARVAGSIRMELVAAHSMAAVRAGILVAPPVWRAIPKIVSESEVVPLVHQIAVCALLRPLVMSANLDIINQLGIATLAQ